MQNLYVRCMQNLYITEVKSEDMEYTGVQEQRMSVQHDQGEKRDKDDNEQNDCVARRDSGDTE